MIIPPTCFLILSVGSEARLVNRLYLMLSRRLLINLGPTKHGVANTVSSRLFISKRARCRNMMGANCLIFSVLISRQARFSTRPTKEDALEMRTQFVTRNCSYPSISKGSVISWTNETRYNYCTIRVR